MKLPIPSFLGKKEASNHYLGLLLRDEKASAVIFKEESGKISVVGKHEEYFPTSVEHATIDEILDTLDRTISRAEETLPPDMETEKTIFGLKETWVEEGHIKKDYLAKLKKVSDELQLSPVGFLVISEAISKLIEEEEGAPLSAIIAEIGKNNVTLTLFKAGRNIESHSSHIEESIPKTVDALLKTFDSVEVLPSRVIIFDGEHGEEIAQQFISHQWSRSIAFLHMPQVSVLKAGFDGRAVVYGAAIQMGFEVSSSIVDHTSEDIKTLESEHVQKGSRRAKGEGLRAEGAEEDEKTEGESEEEEKIPAEEFPASGDNFGFVMGKDIGAGSTDSTHEKLELDASENKNESGEKTADSEAPQFIEHKSDSFQSFSDEEEEKLPEHDDPRNQQSSTGKKMSFTSALGGILGILKVVKLPKKLLFSALKGSGKMLLIPPIIIIVLIAAVLFYVFKLQATVTIHISPKTQEENESVTFSSKDGNDFANSVIAAKAVSTTIDGNSSIDTTGKKEVGDKAKGSITIYNTSDSKKTFSSGTVVTSGNDLEFTLDKDVTVASGSGDVFTGTKPGTTQVAVTAKNIGSEYNLPSGTKFNLAGASSQIAAKNESAFSGGSKKTVQVVAKKDIDKISDSLSESLKEKAKTDLKKDMTTDEELLPDFTDITLSKKIFNKKEGDEAKTLTLKASVTFEGLSYSSKDVTEFAKTLLKDKVDDNQALSNDTLSFKVGDTEDVSADKIKVKLGIEAGILPKLDKEQIVKELTGKSFGDAESYLKSLPQVASSDINLSPNIPLLPKILPRIGNNIKVVVDTNG